MDAWREADPRLQLAVSETWKALDAQREQLGEMRARIAGALSLATIAFGFVNGSVLTNGKLHGWAWPPLIGIGGLFGLVLFSVWPRKWSFVRFPASFRWFWENGKTHDELLSSLYEDGSCDYDDNAVTLRRIEIANQIAAVVFGAVLFALVLAIAFTK